MPTDTAHAAFLERRAAQEVEAAQRATHPAAVQAHYRLSTIYLEQLRSSDRDPREERLAAQSSDCVSTGC